MFSKRSRRRSYPLLVAMALVSLDCKKEECMGVGCEGDTADMRMNLPDLSKADDDLRKPPEDLSMVCGGPETKFATSAIKLPQTGAAYQIDVDGDGRPDNQFLKLLEGVGLAGLDLQAPVDQAVAAGQLVGLMNLKAPALDSASCVALDVHTAAPAAFGDPRPKYDGSDIFKIPAGQMPAALTGGIATSQLSTTEPPKLDPDKVQKLQLDLPILAGMVNLPIYGVHVQGRVSQTGIVNGEIHGVIRKEDIDGRIIPAIAALLTAQINADPGSATTAILIRLFEDMTQPATRTKCMVANDCCAKSPSTCKILPEEVKNNGLIGTYLAPDVQVFEGMKWKPVPRGPNKDAMTIGLGFTAVGAKF